MIAAIRQAIKPNWIDRAVGYLAPVLGAKRMQARAAMALSGYIGARWDRRATKEWYVPSGTADDTLLPDSQTLRDRSRDLIRNTPLATGAVNTVVQNVVGGGLQLQARPEWEALEMSEDQADEWKAGVEREFRLWAESTECDITRTQNFYGLQDLVFRAVLEAGDCAVLTPMVPARTSPYSLRLQVIEAERLANTEGKQDTERLKAGIEFDENGAPVAYHIRRKHPYSFEGLKDRSAARIEAFGKRTGRRSPTDPQSWNRYAYVRGTPLNLVDPLGLRGCKSRSDVVGQCKPRGLWRYHSFWITGWIDNGHWAPSGIYIPGTDIELANWVIDSWTPIGVTGSSASSGSAPAPQNQRPKLTKEQKEQGFNNCVAGAEKVKNQKLTNGIVETAVGGVGILGFTALTVVTYGAAAEAVAGETGAEAVLGAAHALEATDLHSCSWHTILAVVWQRRVPRHPRSIE
ncbi:MAG TPA: phage portal protein [Alphaproteobacteria bacterium]|nr:phage portal protein [Alphaproteobacteria bacterium]